MADAPRGLTALSVRRPIGVGVLAAAICILGYIAVIRLPVDLLPEVDFPRITIVTTYEGVGPEEIENLLTRPIEQAVSTIDGVTTLGGESAEGLSRVTLQFDWGTDLDTAVNDVRAALDRLRARLPEDAEAPTVLKFDISATPVATLGLSGTGDPRRLRYLADEVLTRRLERLPGIASVQVNGGRVRELRVALALDRLTALGISGEQVVRALAADNRNVSAGDMTESGREVLVRTLGELRTVADIEGVLVTRVTPPGAAPGTPGRPIYVRDVATVTDAFQEIKSEQWVDGQPGIVMRVSRQSGANTVEVVERMREELARINAEYAGRARVIVVTDAAQYIRASITNVRESAIVGAVLAVLILLVFLRDLRATLVIALSIPFSILATFALMYFAGYSLNLISFGGLALGVGMLVDNSIVILENIYRKREEGLPAHRAAIEGAREVTAAIVSGTLTTVAVFAPVVFLAGFAGVFFSEMAMVVVFSLMCSLIVAITLVPTLAARLLGRAPGSQQALGPAHRAAAALERAFQRLEAAYGRLLQATLRHRALALAVALVAMLGAYRLVALVQVELMPQTDEGLVDVDFELPVGTPVARTREVVFEMERRLRAVLRPGEVDNIVSSAGPDNPYRPGGGHEGELEVTLVPLSQRDRGSAEILAAMRRALEGIPDVKLRMRQRTTNPLQRFMRGSQGERLVVEVRGHELDTAAALGRRVEAVMKSIPGIADVRIERVEGLEERTVQVDTARAADLGLTRAEIAATLETYVLGKVATRLREGGDEYDIRVMLRDEDRAATAQLAALPVRTPTGVVPLSAVAAVGVRRGPGSIEREGQERVLTLVGGLGDRSLGAVVADLEAALAQLELPAGFTLAVGGEAREQASTFAGLEIGIVLALLLVFAVMAVQFESLRDPLIVMSAVPFGFVGVVATLVASGTTFSLNAFLGCIVLVGIAVNNAIVLIDAANLIRVERGVDAVAAVVEAGRRRLRPILMTTLTTVLAMLPIALAIGEGAEIQAPLARVVLGGLTVSTLITLVLLPVLYVLTDKGRRPVRRTPRYTAVMFGRAWSALLLALVASSAAAEAPGPAGVPDARCAAPPAVAPAGFRHKRSRLIARSGPANHRGIDVIAHEGDATQAIAGKLAYGKVDKDVEDEDVEVFACEASRWRSLGAARTDDDGRFAFTLAGDARLGPGLRDLYVAARGDGSGAYFVGYVARAGEHVIVTDVDGTITHSENAIIKSAVRGSDIPPHANAPAGFAASPHVIVYLTARGDVFTDLTRGWLARHGFPRGVLRLTRGAFARPGKQAIAHKTAVLKAFTIPILAGIGNRQSDIVAYSRVGVPARGILIYLPEHAAEVGRDLAAGRAIGFTDYAQLPRLLPAAAPAPRP